MRAYYAAVIDRKKRVLAQSIRLSIADKSIPNTGLSAPDNYSN